MTDFKVNILGCISIQHIVEQFDISKINFEEDDRKLLARFVFWWLLVLKLFTCNFDWVSYLMVTQQLQISVFSTLAQ